MDDKTQSPLGVTLPTLSQEQFHAFVLSRLCNEMEMFERVIDLLQYAVKVGAVLSDDTRVGLMRSALRLLFFVGANKDVKLLRKAAAVDAEVVNLEKLLPEQFGPKRSRPKLWR